MNNDQPARIIFEFLLMGNYLLNWSGLTLMSWQGEALWIQVLVFYHEMDTHYNKYILLPQYSLSKVRP